MGGISKVKLDLDNAKGIYYWSVDIESVDKILTVSSKGITKEEVISIIKNKGFKIEPLQT